MLKNCFLFLLLSFLPLSLQASCLCPLVEFLVEVAEDHRKEPEKPVPIIAIGGCPGVGKSHLTKHLISRLKEKGIRCLSFAIDDFNLSSEERKKLPTEWDINHFKCDQLHETLSKINSNQRLITKPTYDQIKGTVGEEEINLQDADLVIFEGIYSLCSQDPLNFFAYCSYGIYLEANEKDVVDWKWKRELKKISPRSPDRFKKHMKAMLEEFYRNISYSKKNAAFVIKKDSLHNCALENVDEEKLIAKETVLNPSR